MDNVLFNIKSKIRYSNFGEKIVDAMQGSHMMDFSYKIFDALKLTDSAKDSINPSENFIKEMNNSKLFFTENTLRIEKIYNNLKDDFSKEVFNKAIRYRQTFDIKDRPPFTFYNQYFVKDIIKLNDNEVFVDCGAYTGDTIQRFTKECRGKYKRIIAFEPNVVNSNKIRNQNISNCIIINAGVWNETTTLSFSIQDDSTGFKISQAVAIGVNKNDLCTEKIQVQTIDETESCHDCTFIKMDIEGSEMNALIGAKKTITKMRPKLAICIYHNDEDMLQIPEWIIDLNLDYKLFIRHHSGARYETVVYAIPE